MRARVGRTRKRDGRSSVTEIIWSPQAIEDVVSIREFISRDSPAYGALVAGRLEVHRARLSQRRDDGDHRDAEPYPP